MGMNTSGSNNRAGSMFQRLFILWSFNMFVIDGMYTADGIERETLQRWVAGLDAELGATLSAPVGEPSSVLFYSKGDTLDDVALFQQVSKKFASPDGREHLKQLKQVDDEFATFNAEEKDNKQEELCRLARSDSSRVSTEVADCLCGDTEDEFVHCEARLEQEMQQGLESPVDREETVPLEISLENGDYLTLCEVEVYSASGEKLKLSNAEQSSTGWGGSADRAIDGNTNANYSARSCSHTEDKGNLWWRATLQYSASDPPSRMVVYNRDSIQDRLRGFVVSIDGQQVYTSSDARSVYEFRTDEKTVPLEISLENGDYLTLCEVEVYSASGEKLKLSNAEQSSIKYSGSADRAIDGNTDGNYSARSCTHTEVKGNLWWRATLRYSVSDPPSRMVVYNRDSSQDRLRGFVVSIDGQQVYTSSDTRSVYEFQVQVNTGIRPFMSVASVSSSSKRGCNIDCQIADIDFCDGLREFDVTDLVGFLDNLSGYAFLEEGGYVGIDCEIQLPPPLPLVLNFGARLTAGGIDIDSMSFSREQAKQTKVDITGSVCLPGSQVDELGFIFDALEFLGVSRCALELAATLSPLLGSFNAVVNANLFIVKTNMDITWLYDEATRDSVGVCEGLAGGCSKGQNLDCALCNGDTFISGRVTFRILFWEITHSSDSHDVDECVSSSGGGTCQTGLTEKSCWPDGAICGAGTTCKECCNPAYNALGTQCGGNRWEDGEICGELTTCKFCKNPSSYWIGKLFTACGTEPCWSDGTVCGAGTTCDLCCNPAYNALGTQCGGEAWKDGEICGAGTTCNFCENPSSYWISKFFTACGTEPCWSDGTVCGAGTTCDLCCNTAYNALGTQCGGEAWKDGEICGAGTTCNFCKNPSSYWIGKAFTACGEEPCWSDGTVCGAGTTCNECCNPAYNALGTQCGGQAWRDGTACGIGTTCNLCRNGHSWWIGKAFTACGREPCWKRGTVCGTGTTCNSCCKGSHCPWYWFGVCECK